MEYAISGHKLAFSKQSSVLGSWNVAPRSALRLRVNLGNGEIFSLISRKTSFKSSCNGVADFAGAMALDWRPALDEVLLMSSILLAYVAGVVRPPSRPQISATLNAAAILPILEPKKDTVWDCVNQKLLNAASEANSPNSDVKTPCLCLHALAYGPRLRLLLITLTMLRNELQISKSIQSVELICDLIGPVCRTWIAKEQQRRRHLSASLPPDVLEDETLSVAVENSAKVYISKIMEKNGKREFYSEMLFYFANSVPRSGSFLDEKACRNLSESAMEDLLVTISEGAAAMYLGAFSSNNSGWPSLLRSSISSTRSLERFQNEFAN